MNIAIKIEDMKIEAEVLRSIVLAIYDAMYTGYCHVNEEYEGALRTVLGMATDHMDHLQSLMDEAYALMRSGKEYMDK